MGTRRAAVVAFLERHHLQYQDSRTISHYNGPPKLWGILSESPGFMATDFLYTF
ncbi:MAG: hypothetical protein P4M04_05825 [Acidobacteriota bacterium]|nr:hypothetical protein [Acidobacteriota bacterium]